MKIGILFDGLELPPKNGVTFRFYYLTKLLIKKGVDVVVFFCDRGWVKKSLLEKEFGHAHLFSPRIFYKKLSFVQNIVKSEDVDILQVNNSASVLWYGAKYSQNLRIPLLTEMHDFDAAIKKTLGANEAIVNKMKFTQYAAGMLSHSIITMTDQDKRELIEIGIPKNKLNLIPNGIDTTFFSYSKPNLKSKQMVFLGNMFYLPNKNAAELLIIKVMPKIDANLLCIGMVPDEFKKKYSSKKVTFSGGIDDIRPLLKQSSLAVAPIFQGSGMKVKMLSFAAAGVPIITTDIGISGYPKGFTVVENNIEKYSQKIKELLNSSDQLESQSIMARELVEKYFSWDKISDDVINVYRKIEFSKQESVIPKNIFGDIEYDSRVLFSERSPLPMWLEEDRAKFSADVSDYVKI